MRRRKMDRRCDLEKCGNGESRLRKATEERIVIRIESWSWTTRVLDKNER
jgi:hypothetical protein